MTRFPLLRAAGVVAAAACALALGSCSSSDYDGGSNVHGSVSMYYGAGYYDPWYYGPGYPPPVIVTNPPNRPPSTRPPTTKPRPTPLPSRPAPRPSPRPMPRGR
jgi:hypothetical protein